MGLCCNIYSETCRKFGKATQRVRFSLGCDLGARDEFAGDKQLKVKNHTYNSTESNNDINSYHPISLWG